MIIGFDAKRAVSNTTGLGNYSRHMIEILASHHPDNHYVLFAPQSGVKESLDNVLPADNVSIVYPRTKDMKGWIGKLAASLWRATGIKKDIRKSGVTLYHGLSGELPVGIKRTGVKTVVTVHDLIFIRYPRYYKAVDRFIYTMKVRYALGNADRIIATSECTKRDIVSFFGIRPHKVTVVYQGADPVYYMIAPAKKKLSVAGKYNLPASFILSVGTIEERKNLMLAVKALKHVARDIHLVAIGRPTAYQAEVMATAARLGVESRLHILNDVETGDMPAIYQMAKLFVYPSFFEGFGIPVVEALMSALPVIAAKGSCLEEVGGPGSVYIDPLDDKALAARITSLLDDEEALKLMCIEGRKHIRRFSNVKTASRLVGIYKELCER
jgi:glycosyltransferase involved in cell wall biosynthesis